MSFRTMLFRTVYVCASTGEAQHRARDGRPKLSGVGPNRRSQALGVPLSEGPLAASRGGPPVELTYEENTSHGHVVGDGLRGTRRFPQAPQTTPHGYPRVGYVRLGGCHSLDPRSTCQSNSGGGSRRGPLLVEPAFRRAPTPPRPWLVFFQSYGRLQHQAGRRSAPGRWHLTSLCRKSLRGE